MINIYEYLDYRICLRDMLADRKGTARAISNSKLAEAMRMQASYLSRILQKNAHASSDQLFLGCQALELSVQETDFLLLLLDWARCDLPVRKEPLRKRINGIQEAKRGSDQVLGAEFVIPEASSGLSEYYLDPVVPIVHACLSIPAYQSKPELIAQYLGIVESKLKESIETLVRLGIVAGDGKKTRYRIIKNHIHLDRKSVLNNAYQILFRHYSIEHLRRTSQEDKFQFAVTISADEAAKTKIHDEFNAFLKKIEVIVKAAPSEGAYQICFDLFRWDHKR